jgi:hypothetical protein
MGDCLNKVIRWPVHLLKTLESQRTGTGRSTDTKTGIVSPVHRETECNPAVLLVIGTLQEFGGNPDRRRPYCRRTRPYCRRTRPYCRRTRLHRRASGPRIIGRSRVERLSMDSVVSDKEKVLCSQRCLHDIDVEEILLIRCLALGSSNYEKRTTWVINTLQSFMTRENTMTMREHLKCITRVYGKRVCNACFALAIGYSRSRLAALITDIRNTTRSGSIHGNRHHRREKNNTTIARVLFEQYVKDFGEPMPNRQTRRFKDGQLIWTICLPMSVRRAEIWLTINSKLQRMDQARIGLPTFHQMWKREFTPVHIP